MHKININLHNLKTALIFSMAISRDSSSWHGLRTYQITKFFVAPRPRSEGGEGEQPKKLAWLGLSKVQFSHGRGGGGALTTWLATHPR